MTLGNRQRRRVTDVEEARCRRIGGGGGWCGGGERVEDRPGSKLLFTFSHVANISQLPRAILSSKLSKQPPGVLYWHSLSWLLADYTLTHTHLQTHTYTHTHTQQFNTDTQFLRTRSRSAATLYIYKRRNHCSHTLSPSDPPWSHQHVHIS